MRTSCGDRIERANRRKEATQIKDGKSPVVVKSSQRETVRARDIAAKQLGVGPNLVKPGAGCLWLFNDYGFSMMVPYNCSIAINQKVSIRYRRIF